MGGAASVSVDDAGASGGGSGALAEVAAASLESHGAYAGWPLASVEAALDTLLRRRDAAPAAAAGGGGGGGAMAAAAAHAEPPSVDRAGWFEAFTDPTVLRPDGSFVQLPLGEVRARILSRGTEALARARPLRAAPLEYRAEPRTPRS